MARLVALIQDQERLLQVILKGKSELVRWIRRYHCQVLLASANPQVAQILQPLVDQFWYIALNIFDKQRAKETLSTLFS